MTFPPSLFHNITPNTPQTASVPSKAVHPPSFTVSPPQEQIPQLDHTPTPSLDQPDDETINSTNSNLNMSLVIKPCHTYSKYGIWLKQQFPCIMNQREGFFVHSILKIRSMDDVQVYNDYTSLEWKEHLNKSYHLWMKTTIELVIIWNVTLEVYDEVPFSQYLEVRNEMLPLLYPMYEEHIKPPTPPPYTPVSPFVKEYNEEMAKASKVQLSNKLYRTTAPEPVFAPPKTIITEKVENNSVHSSSHHSSHHSNHHS